MRYPPVLDDLRSRRELMLGAFSRRRRTAQTGVARSHLLESSLTQLNLSAEGSGRRLAHEIVAGSAQATGADEELHARPMKDLDDRVLFVANAD